MSLTPEAVENAARLVLNQLSERLNFSKQGSRNDDEDGGFGSYVNDIIIICCPVPSVLPSNMGIILMINSLLLFVSVYNLSWWISFVTLNDALLIVWELYLFDVPEYVSKLKLLKSPDVAWISNLIGKPRFLVYNKPLRP